MLSKAILLSYFSKLTSKRLHQLATVISPDELWQAPAHTLRTLDWRDDTIAEFFRHLTSGVKKTHPQAITSDIPTSVAIKSCQSITPLEASAKPADTVTTFP